MTSQKTHREGARAAWLLALFLSMFVGIAPARGTSSLEAELAAACGELPETLRARLTSLRKERVPLATLAHKLREGVAKRVACPRLLPVLEEVAQNLMWLDQKLARCLERQPDARGALLDLGNDLLLGGVARAKLEPALAALCKLKDPRAALAQLAELYLLLVGSLEASRPLAWDFAAAGLARGDAASALGPLVVTLQDIYRDRGSVDRPLTIALGRLTAGASLRTIKNELREQFLRP